MESEWRCLISNLSFAYRHLVPAKIFAFSDLANNENSFARAFGGDGGTVNAGGDAPRIPPLLVTSRAHSPFLCFLQEKIFGE